MSELGFLRIFFDQPEEWLARQLLDSYSQIPIRESVPCGDCELGLVIMTKIDAKHVVRIRCNQLGLLFGFWLTSSVIGHAAILWDFSADGIDLSDGGAKIFQFNWLQAENTRTPKAPEGI